MKLKESILIFSNSKQFANTKLMIIYVKSHEKEKQHKDFYVKRLTDFESIKTKAFIQVSIQHLHKNL